MGEEKEIELFVPGRLCLFGEHSDWAGGHRRQNSKIEKGYTIIAQTNQGNYATVKEINNQNFQFISQPFKESLEVKLEEQELLKIAEEGGLFSYVAGVAHEIISSYRQCHQHGIIIDNYKTDLPIKSGLSSSASVCVLTTKAFNEIYDLGFTNRRIMELAYLGETTTPSRCGRMDQACAYNEPVLMTFDGDRVDAQELAIGRDMFLLIVNLKKGKDTMKILSDLNEGFPWPRSDFERKKHTYFSMINKRIVFEAKQAINNGDAETLGNLMKEAQMKFDNYLAPSSPEQLTAPVLHSMLSMPEIQKFILGGKGVGSGGDGTAQLVCKSKEDREKVRTVLERKNFGCLDLNLKKT
ncbi:MAG: GHMP kinase [Candidatus Pacearchaeota archaeon]|nr:GHMP kinase [Candidatus Pacearchaeota archaeon]